MKTLVSIGLVLLIILSFLLFSKQSVGVNSFQECVDLGYFVMESYPRQCNDGETTFVEELPSEPTPDFLAAHPKTKNFSVHITGEDLLGLTVTNAANLWGVDATEFLNELVSEFNLVGDYTTNSELSFLHSEKEIQPVLVKELLETLR